MMHRVLLPAVALSACLACGAVAQQASDSPPADAAPDAPVVQTQAGPVQGVARNGALEFRAIPYAAPPVGALRWAAPRLPAPWTEPLDASAFRSTCPQARSGSGASGPSAPSPGPTRAGQARVSPANAGQGNAGDAGAGETSADENCLHLDVTVPLEGAQAASAARPVLVWIHGGDFVHGAASQYRLDELARSGDVVVVAMNYRLGVLGFMAHPAFDAADNGALALEDQRLALRWVQQNIGRFGGDPDNVTLAGESAGAVSVCMHLAAPEQSGGLYQSAIIDGAGCAQPLRRVEDSARLGQEVARRVGCADRATALACLRAKPVADLLAAASAAGGADPMAFAPSVGSRTAPQQAGDALRSGNFIRVPLLVGFARDAQRLAVALDAQAGRRVTPETYGERLRVIYGANAAAVAQRYAVGNYASAAIALGTAMSDFHPALPFNACGALRAAELAARVVPVFAFEFADRTAPTLGVLLPATPNPGFELGAALSSDLSYLFPGFSGTSRSDAPELPLASRALARQLVAAWTSFARAAVPQEAGVPAWRPLRAANLAMRFEPGRIAPYDAAAAHNCTFWRGLYPQVLGGEAGAGAAPPRATERRGPRR